MFDRESFQLQIPFSTLFAQLAIYIYIYIFPASMNKSSAGNNRRWEKKNSWMQFKIEKSINRRGKNSCHHHHHHHRDVLTPWIPLTFSHSNRPVFLEGPIDDKECSHSADVCMFLLVSQYLCISVQDSTGKHLLLVRPYFTGSAKHVLFVLFAWFLRWEIGGRTAAILKCAVLGDLFIIAFAQSAGAVEYTDCFSAER